MRRAAVLMALLVLALAALFSLRTENVGERGAPAQPSAEAFSAGVLARDLLTVPAGPAPDGGETEGMIREEGRGFTLVYSGAKRLIFEGELMALLQRERDDIEVALGVFPRGALTVLILTPDLGEKGVSPDPAMTGLYDGRIRLYLGEGRPDPGKLAATVRHELVHALLVQASPEFPVWFHEGLAQRLGERITDSQVADLRSRILQEEGAGWWVPPLSIEGSLGDLPPGERAREYAQSLLFLDFLQRRYGTSVVPRIVGAVAGGKGFEEAGWEATGTSTAEWQRQYQREMGR